jgi:hypothetical protein
MGYVVSNPIDPGVYAQLIASTKAIHRPIASVLRREQNGLHGYRDPGIDGRCSPTNPAASEIDGQWISSAESPSAFWS